MFDSWSPICCDEENESLVVAACDADDAREQNKCDWENASFLRQHFEWRIICLEEHTNGFFKCSVRWKITNWI